MENQKIIYVYENWSNNLPNLIGRLYVDTVKGKENYSFEYDSLSLYVDETDNTIDLDLALSVANQFGLKQDEAKEIIGNILKVVSDYKDIAKGLGISQGSIEYMEPAFYK